MKSAVQDPRLYSPLAIFAGARPPAPQWFTETLAQKPREARIIVDGAGIETLSWGEIGKPGLLLMHGNGAHAGWYRFIAPFFARDYHVVALSWSGMGGSDWRTNYTMEHFSAELMGVAEQTGLFSGVAKPIAAAHSFGSFPLVTAMSASGERFGGAIIVDSPFWSPERRAERRKARNADKPQRPGADGHRIYPNVTAALARFRLAPLQSCENLYIADLIAREGLKSTPLPSGVAGEMGCTWRFDAKLWRDLQIGDVASALNSVKCRMALIRGERSQLMHPEDAAHVLSLLPADSLYLEIPDADHHVMIDQPLAFVAALRALLAAWR